MFNFKKEKKIEKEDGWGTGTGEYYTKEVINIPKIVIFSVVGLFLIITLFASFKTIKSGEVGLKVRFGKIVSNKLNEGFNFKIPYIEKIVKVNIKVQKVELTTESSTKDMQIVNTAIAVNYRVDSSKADDLYRKVGNNYETVILEPAIKESIKSAIAKYNAEEITVKRAEVSVDCLKVIQNKTKKYGIIIEDFNLTNIEFSKEYTNAIEKKQVAEQDLAKSKLESERKVIEAQATKEANELLKQTLTDEVIAKQFIEKWDGKLPETYAGGDILKMFNIK